MIDELRRSVHAIEFTADGEVVLRAQCLAQGPDSIELHFDVSDAGIGIPAQNKERIFEAFSQADSSTTRDFGGPGFGLTISSQLVGKTWLLNLVWSRSVTPGRGV